MVFYSQFFSPVKKSENSEGKQKMSGRALLARQTIKLHCVDIQSLFNSGKCFSADFEVWPRRCLVSCLIRTIFRLIVLTHTLSSVKKGTQPFSRFQLFHSQLLPSRKMSKKGDFVAVGKWEPMEKKTNKLDINSGKTWKKLTEVWIKLMLH